MTIKTPLRLPLDAIPPAFADAGALTPVEAGDVRRYRDVEYARLDGYRPLLLDLSIPSTHGLSPLVVLIHGGAWLGGSKNIEPPDIADFGVLQSRLLEEGIAVASIQYRLSCEATFPAQLHDVKAAIRWLRNAAPALGIDPERIASLGASAGGHLAVFLGTNTTATDLEGTVGLTGPSSAVCASVGWYPPTRLDTMQAESMPGTPFTAHSAPDSPESRLIGHAVSERPDLARHASPISHVSGATAPTLLVHGTLDQVVPHEQSVAHHGALDEAGVPNRLELVEGADHGFFGGDVDAIVETTVAFLREHFSFTKEDS
ncbi:MULTISPECIES: alpha/beta hydrolase fold domain-containing protein [Streptomyces]|uniref:alpha/beta hydrolase fold domain-containing protein n=1 Tax=Streptomyces TaxID=1883 RepID=UPI0036C2FD26